MSWGATRFGEKRLRVLQKDAVWPFGDRFGHCQRDYHIAEVMGLDAPPRPDLPLSYKSGTTCRSLGSSTRCLIGYGTGWHRMNEAALGQFGDKRREDLGAVLLDAVESKRTLCIHRLAEDRNQTIRFNNFLANPAVSTHEMLVTAGRKTNQCAAGRHVLARSVGAGAGSTIVARPSGGKSGRCAQIVPRSSQSGGCSPPEPRMRAGDRIPDRGLSNCRPSVGRASLPPCISPEAASHRRAVRRSGRAVPVYRSSAYQLNAARAAGRRYACCGTARACPIAAVDRGSPGASVSFLKPRACDRA